MTDATDDVDVLGHQLLRKSRMNPLRERLEEFVSENPAVEDLKQLRREAAQGRDLSEFVEQEREERL